MRAWLSLFVLVGVTGCIHRSPEAQVLAALDHARIGGAAKASVADSTTNCTALQTKLARLEGDTAIVRIWQDCASRCPTGSNCMNSVRLETDYLMVRRNGKWNVEHVAGGAAVIGSWLMALDTVAE